jgi:uncharacterized protein YqjF (DUF2071 family)
MRSNEPDECCPEPVRLASMTQRWDGLTFVHFEYEPSDVAALLPRPLRPDTFDGAAWVSLVPFEMQHVRLTGLPPVPGARRFHETNVRTYVVGPDGTPGVYFFSLDVPGRAVVLTARVGFRLPYRHARMTIERSGHRIRYRCRRTGDPAAASDLLIETGDPVRADPLDVFLTSRWGLFTATRPDRVRYTPVEHDPWPLQQATVHELDDTLVAAAGLPEPQDRMVVRYSPGIDVRIGLPRRVRATAGTLRP